MKNIRQWHSAIIRNIRDYGLTVTIRKISGYLIKPVYENRACRVYTIQLANESTGKVNSGSSFIFRNIHADDLDWIQQIESMEEWLEGKLRKMLLSDHFCLVALDGQRIAGFNLVAMKVAEIPLLNMVRTLDGAEAWSVQITVDRSYRKKGLGRALRSHVFEELRRKGFKKFSGAALLSNTGSLRLAKRAGFKDKEDIRYIKILGYKRWVHKEVA